MREGEWVLLVKTIGRIRDIDNLWFCCRVGSRDFDSYQAVADAVNSAHSLRKLVLNIDSQTFPRAPSGLAALANALREHTVLQEFTVYDNLSSWTETAPPYLSLDPVFRALIACPYLRWGSPPPVGYHHEQMR